MKRTLSGMAVLATALATGATGALAQDLVLSIGSRGYGPVVEETIAAFEEVHPDIHVEWNRVSDVPNESRKLYVTSLTARSPTPDVFAIDVIWAGEFAERGWLEPLDDALGSERVAAFNASFLEAAQVDGTTYAAPLYLDGTHLFYRSDLLNKYGLDAPETWEDVISASKTIQEGEGNPQLYGFVSMWAKIEGLFMNWLSFVNGNGGGFFGKDGNVAVNSPENVEATQAMVDILHEHDIAPASILNMRPDDARTLFQQGRAVFLMVQDFVYDPLAAEDSPVAGRFDFTRIPYFEGHPEAHTTAMGGWFLAVNPRSRHKEAAAALVAFFTSPERQLMAALEANRAPAVPTIYDDPRMAAAQVLAKFGRNYDVGVVRPSAGTGSLYPRISEIMQLEITNALHRRKPVEEALDDAQDQIEALVAR